MQPSKRLNFHEPRYADPELRTEKVQSVADAGKSATSALGRFKSCAVCPEIRTLGGAWGPVRPHAGLGGTGWR